MFRVPVENKYGEIGERVIGLINEKSKNMAELEFLFWLNWLARWFDVEINEISDYTRENFRKEILELEKDMYGVKKRVNMMVKDKEDRIKIVKKKVESEVELGRRVEKRVDNFGEDGKAVLKWVFKVGNNRFSVLVLERYLDKNRKLTDERECEYLMIMKWLLGQCDCNAIVSYLCKGVLDFKAVKVVNDIMIR